MDGEIKVSIKTAEEFRRTLREYIKYNKRTLAKIVNTKAYHIAIVACHETYRAKKEDIQRGIGQLAFDIKRTKSGRGIRRAKLSELFTKTAGGYYHSAKGVPIAALIINKLRGKGGQKGLYGAEMKYAIAHFVQRRFSAIGYLASGWLPAIKKLASLADRGKFNYTKPSESGFKVDSPYLGGAIPATESISPSAKIFNTANSRYSTTKDPLTKYGLPALEKGFEVERQSMLQYMEEKLKQSAHACGIRTA